MKNIHSLSRLTIALTLLSIVSTGAMAESLQFRFEPTRKATATSGGRLKAGDVVVVKSANINKDEQLHLYKCGEPCNTAKKVASWSTNDLKNPEKQTVNLTEAGSYYLWIQKHTKEGYSGPVFGDTETEGKGKTILRYQSGTVLSVSVIRE